MSNRKVFARSIPGACFLVLALAASARADEDYIPIFKPLNSSSLVVAGRSQGSGFLIDAAERIMVTNRHVVTDNKTAFVMTPLFDNGLVLVRRDYYLRQARRIRARVLGTDSKRDLALLQLNERPAGLVEMKLAAASPRQGERTHMIGNPGKQKHLWVYSMGTVRTVSQAKLVYDNGQRIGARVIGLTADGQLGRGASGGPVANDQGDLIGVISAGRLDGRELTCIDVSEVRYFLGTTYRKMATAAIGERDYFQALALCDKALRTYTEDPLSHNERGVALSFMDSLDEAVSSYTAALKIDPTLVRAYRNRGSAHYHKGRYKEAIADCTEAIRRAPDYISAYRTRAMTYTKLNLTAEAEADNARIKSLEKKSR